MSTEQRLEQLERRLHDLEDRRDIIDCIARHARGCDRHDSEVLANVYHQDGIDEHGYAVNPGPKYPEWANPAHTALAQQHLHNITTHLCEIDGDVAHAESYVIGVFLDPDGKTGRVLAGRYADRLGRRDGAWRIALRRSTVEVALTGDATSLTSADFAKLGYLKGLQGKRDVTYQRPLKLEDTPSDHRW